MLPQRKKNGFTLIELLVSISIIAVISAIGITSYAQTQSIARDAKRKQDLRTIASALELYYQVNKHYPCTTLVANSFGTGNSDKWWVSYPNNWILDAGLCYIPNPGNQVMDSKYISKMPNDPKADPSYNVPGSQPVYTNGKTGYMYWSGPVTGSGCPTGTSKYYILAAGLENDDDKESNKNMSYKICNGTVVADPATYKNLFVVTP